MEIIFFGIALLLVSILSFEMGKNIMKRKIEQELLEVLGEHRDRLEQGVAKRRRNTHEGNKARNEDKNNR